jgi:thioredoxin 1
MAEYSKLKQNLLSDETICFMDGVHPTHSVQPASGWIQKGVRKEIPPSSGRSRINFSGVIDVIDHKVLAQEDRMLNTEATISFFRKTEEAYPRKNRIHVFCDFDKKQEALKYTCPALAYGIRWKDGSRGNLSVSQQMFLKEVFYKSLVLNKNQKTPTSGNPLLKLPCSKKRRADKMNPPLKEERMSTQEDIKHLSEDTFTKDIQHGIVLVDFYADWCGPCRMMTPVLEKVAKDVKGTAVVGKLDIDSAQKIAAQFQVTSIPTLILYKDGKEVGRLVGLRDAATVKQLIDGAK